MFRLCFPCYSFIRQQGALFFVSLAFLRFGSVVTLLFGLLRFRFGFPLDVLRFAFAFV